MRKMTFRENKLIFKKPLKSGAEQVNPNAEGVNPNPVVAKNLSNRERISGEKVVTATNKNEREGLKEEIQDQKAGILDQLYRPRIEQLNDRKPEDTNTLRESVREVRYNTNLLEKAQEVNANTIKNETARRMNAYTDKYADGWYKLNYSQVGKDKKNLRHEIFIGLGDIIIDPSIKEIMVQKDGEIIEAERDTVTSGQHKGRLGFVDKKTREYIKTFDGDMFKIISNEAPKNQKVLDDYKHEVEIRNEHSKGFDTEVKMSVARHHDMGFDTGLNLDAGLALSNQVATSDEDMENKLNTSIVQYSKQSCEEFGVPFPVYKELTKLESRFNPLAKNPRSTASGLGQFINGTWKKFIDYCERNNIFDEKWGEKPLTNDHRFNPYCSAYATAWLMSQTEKSFGGLNAKPLHHQGVIYYLAHHEGVGGAKKFINFLEKMKADGANTNAEIVGKYQENPQIYKELLDTRQGNLMDASPEEQLAVFILAKKVGFRAAASDPELIEKVKQGEMEQYAKLNRGPQGKREVMEIKGGQERWIFGSSTAVGLGTSRHLSKQSGFYGIESANAETFLAKLQEAWPHIKHLKMPKEIILLGLASNNIDEGAPIIIEQYKKVFAFLRSHGAESTQFKIATVTPLNEQDTKRIEFNRYLMENEPDLALNISPEDISKHVAGVHLNQQGYKIVADIIEKKETT